MSHLDLVVRGGAVVQGSDLVQVDLGIAGGLIVEISPDLGGRGAREIDARGLHVFPGLIDAHVHFNEPGRTDWEGFATGSAAIAAGGGALYFDMPLNAHPPTVDVAAFDLKRAAAQGASYVDFALWGGLVPGNVEQLAPLAERGVIGFKAFMSSSGIDDFAAADDYTLFTGMLEAARLGRIVAVHAESDAITAGLSRQAQREGRAGIRDYLRSRPAIAEIEAISRAIVLAEETGCPLHIVHVSTGHGVTLVAEARARGLDISCETCPHYLVLSEDDLERLGAVAKCAPPLRPVSECVSLWDQLASGALPMVASDHSPSPASMKSGGNFFRVWGGISGCQSTLQLLLTEGHIARDLPVATVARVTSGFIAERFGLARRKGRIGIGLDADLALVDLGATSTITASELRYRHQHSPYIGRRVRGRVVQTLVRGRTIWRDGALVGEPDGRLVTPGA
jgi:allantoinase